VNEGLRRRLGACFLLAHVVAVTAMALPAPVGGLHRGDWREPTVQAELDGAYARLAAWGWVDDRDAFEDGFWAFAVAWVQARRAVLAPVIPYAQWAGTAQSWRMFVAPHAHPTRVRLDVHTPQGWTTWFRERDPKAAWRVEMLSNDRVRSLFFRLGWPHERAALDRFAGWFASQAAAESDLVDRVRVVLEQRETPSAEAVCLGEDVPWTRVVVRERTVRR
jgi:hypothetical protein